MSLKDLMEADLEAVFFNEADLAEPVIWTPSTGQAVIASGIFDETYEAVDPDSGAIVASTRPRVHLMAKALPDGFDIDEGARLAIDSRTYRPVDVQPGGQGVVIVYLHEVRA